MWSRSRGGASRTSVENLKLHIPQFPPRLHFSNRLPVKGQRLSARRCFLIGSRGKGQCVKKTLATELGGFSPGVLLVLVYSHHVQWVLFGWYSLGGSAVLNTGFREIDPLCIILGQDCTSVSVERVINVFSVFFKTKTIKSPSPCKLPPRSSPSTALCRP